MVASPEVSRLLVAYESMSGTIDTRIDSRHHEATIGAQTAFFGNVKAMTMVLQDMGNPAIPILVIWPTVVGHEEYRRPQSCTVSRYQQQFEVFLGGLHNEECSFYIPINKNKVAFFRQEQRISGSKEKALKGDCRLFSQLFISCQTRQCDLQEFFRHGNPSSTASLSDGGKLHTCQKSQLTEILQVRMDMPERASEPVREK